MRIFSRQQTCCYPVCFRIAILFITGVILLTTAVSYAQVDTAASPTVETASTPTPSSENGITQRVYLPFLANGAPSAVVGETAAEEGMHEHGAVDQGDGNIDEQTPLEHFLEDFVVMDAAMEEQLAQAMTPGYGLRAAQADAITDPGVVGSWSAVQDWPVVAIHASLLANGKVLAYDSVSNNPPENEPTHNFTRAALWDPATGQSTRVDVDTGYNLFCSGHAHLPDGLLFVAGGNLNSALQGLDKTHTFNPADNRWTLESTMSQGGRWYPSVTPLANGEMLITEGGPDLPEVRTTAGSLRTLSSASLNLPLYPWLQAAPNGTVFYAGPDQTLRFLDTGGAGAWQTSGQRDGVNRDYGSFAMYDIGKILVSGGGPSSPSAVVINLNGSSPQVTTTAAMNYGRRQHNLTILPDGTVLATGGNSSGANQVDLNNGVYVAEVWNPATGQWTALASMQVTRQYHSIALLLADGRVLSAGGGICATCQQVGYLARNAEVYSPPYLFKKDGSGQLALRPTISTAPSAVAYGERFNVSTPEAAAIQKVSLVRLSSVTHSVNMEQRYIPLSFSQVSGALQVTAPAAANVAPPGYYMLFILNGNGVPSVAKMLQLRASDVVNGTGLTGQYYARRNLTGLKLTRIDATVDFDWGAASPSPAIPSDKFSVRWTGKVQPQFSETYTFYTLSDDGVRLWVNGQLLIDNWTSRPSRENQGTITLVGGQRYDIKLEYYEERDTAIVKLFWSSASQPKQIIPQARLYP